MSDFEYLLNHPLHGTAAGFRAPFSTSIRSRRYLSVKTLEYSYRSLNSRIDEVLSMMHERTPPEPSSTSPTVFLTALLLTAPPLQQHEAFAGQHPAGTGLLVDRLPTFTPESILAGFHGKIALPTL